MKNKILYQLFLAVSVITASSLKAQIILPKIFTDHMVLQREAPVKIWGKAKSSTIVTVIINGQKSTTKSDDNGSWSVLLKPMKWGGPYELSITSGTDQKMLKDILLGDVWICSGQSNMEFPVSGWSQVNNAQKEIAEANHASIRLFTVEKAVSFTPQSDFTGGQWLQCNSENIPPFSAVAYFFGRKINQDTKIPVGLISTNWGGTNIQAWTSWDALSDFEGYNHLDATETKKLLSEQTELRKKYNNALAADPGSTQGWYQNDDTEGWNKIQMPSSWESSEIGNTDGIIWFKKAFELTSPPPYQNICLNLGAIDDADSTYINGVFIGSDNVWNKKRQYTIPPSVLHQGKNTITIKMTDDGAQGGMSGAADDVYIQLNNSKIPLAGEWYYKPSVLSKTYHLMETGPNAFPSQLFNAMIAPVTNFKIKGAIWYQGEANVDEAERYQTLFPNMIADWRKNWGYNFPFLWVQLANFLERKNEPGESAWAELRNAQHQALSVPNTAEAVIIDIGEGNDIHPRNKQEVGIRLALAAEKMVYNKNVIGAGPTFNSLKIEGAKALLTFNNTGSGLVAKNGRLTGFAIAGADKKFVWAKGKIAGSTIIVESDLVKHPIAVRYAWADNPDASLYNKEGLPASPFRTDNWPLTTKDKRSY